MFSGVHTDVNTDNWVAPPDVTYFKVLVSKEFNNFNQKDDVKQVYSPHIATHQAVI